MTQVAEPDVSTRSEPSRINHWIGGRLVEGTSGRHGDVYDPAAGRVAKHVDFASVDEVDAAVAAARAAFPAWRDTPAQQRAAALRRAAQILRDNAQELGWLDAVDGGNPFGAMVYDVELSAAYLDYFAGLVTEVKGATIPVDGKTLHVAPDYDRGVEADIARWFETYYSIRFRNYPVSQQYLHAHETVACR